jgi:hypothetical protein
MRAIGYILLIFGFLWLVLWCGGSVGPLTRSIAIENFQKYSENGKYSGNEVCDAIRNVLEEYRENAHGIALPAAVMLVGGILLDIASKRATKRNFLKTKNDHTVSN